MATVVGKLGGIMRFPIKSLLGETLDECMVSERGLDGDRALALVDIATGKIASAKQPNLWRHMLKLVATFRRKIDVLATSDTDGRC